MRLPWLSRTRCLFIPFERRTNHLCYLEGRLESKRAPHPATLRALCSGWKPSAISASQSTSWRAALSAFGRPCFLHFIIPPVQNNYKSTNKRALLRTESPEAPRLAHAFVQPFERPHRRAYIYQPDARTRDPSQAPSLPPPTFSSRRPSLRVSDSHSRCLCLCRFSVYDPPAPLRTLRLILSLATHTPTHPTNTRDTHTHRLRAMSQYNYATSSSMGGLFPSAPNAPHAFSGMHQGSPGAQHAMYAALAQGAKGVLGGKKGSSK